MLAPWLVDTITQVIIFLVGCSCCGGARKPPNPMIECEIMEDRFPNIPYADSPEEEPQDWDIVHAEEAELFGLLAHSERLHY